MNLNTKWPEQNSRLSKTAHPLPLHIRRWAGWEGRTPLILFHTFSCWLSRGLGLAVRSPRNHPTCMRHTNWQKLTRWWRTAFINERGVQMQRRDRVLWNDSETNPKNLWLASFSGSTHGISDLTDHIKLSSEYKVTHWVLLCYQNQTEDKESSAAHHHAAGWVTKQQKEANPTLDQQDLSSLVNNRNVKQGGNRWMISCHVGALLQISSRMHTFI